MTDLEHPSCSCDVQGCDADDCEVCAVDDSGPCPASYEAHEATVESLVDHLITEGWDGGVVDLSGGDPIASLHVDADLWLDLHCTLRRVPPVTDPRTR